MNVSLRMIAVGIVGALAATTLASCAAAEPDGGSIRVFTPYPEMYEIPLQAVADAYEAEHPDTEIIIESMPYSGYEEALQTQFMGGTAADVLMLEPHIITPFSSRGFLLPLTDALTASDGGEAWADRYSSSALSSLRAQDGIDYVAPWAYIHVKSIYRADIFDDLGIDPPETFSDQLEVNEALKDAGIQPFSWGLNGSDANAWWRLTLMLNAGFRPLTEDINLRHAEGWTYDFTNPEAVAGEVYTADEKYVAFVNGLTDPAKSQTYREAVEMLLKMRDDIGDPANWLADDVVPQFLAGTLGQRTGTDGELPSNVKAAEEAGFGEIQVKSIPLPAVTEEEWPALTAGPTNPLAAVRNGLAVNAETKNPELAIDFMKYATSIEGQNIIFENGFNADGGYTIGQGSAVPGVTYPAGSGLSDEEIELVPELSLYGFGMPPTYDAQDMDEFNGHLQQLWTGAIDVDQFLDLRSASNLAALQRNLEVFADEVDTDFIDANTP